MSISPVFCCYDGIVDRGHLSSFFSSADAQARRLATAQAAGLVGRFADHGVKGALARHLHRGESSRASFADRARWSVAAKSRERHGGPPYFWFAEVASPAAGTWRVTLARDRAPAECSAITREVAVRADAPQRPGTTPGSVWPLRNTWNRTTENLFSAWIEKLFDDPLDAAPSWPALHEVLRDRSRNVLFNHLGLGEDEMGLVIRPDCADLPYFLRAYFVQMGMPFGSVCSRGGAARSRNADVASIQHRGSSSPTSDPHPRLVSAGDAVVRGSRRARRATVGACRTFGRLPNLANGVHSGSGRTLASDNNTDYYPVPLTQETLRPGTVYHDPYGHVLMIVRRVAQTDAAAGVILAVDGQPDGTVARKRFWRGNFLFAQDPAPGGRVQALPPDRATKAALCADNDEIGKIRSTAISLDRSSGSKIFTIIWMTDVACTDPSRDEEAIVARRARRRDVGENGRFQNSGRGKEMPTPAIFETIGPWRIDAARICAY
jgi:hypothetical protein